MSQSTDVDPDAESLRLAQQLEDEEFAAYREPALGFSEAELAEMDDETRQSIELAMRLQEEERLRIQEQQAAAERLEGQADDEESIALAIRLRTMRARCATLSESQTVSLARPASTRTSS